MGWVRIEDSAPKHPKQLTAGPVACWLWVCGLAYSSSHLTNGFIPFEAMPFLGVANWKKPAGFLVSAGLFEKVDGGYRIHDYLDYQFSADDTAERRAARAESGRLGGQRSGETRRRQREALASKQNEATDEANSKHLLEAKPNPIPSHQEDPPVVPLSGDEHPEPSAIDQRFETWWLAYPKTGRVGRGKAERVWRKCKPSAALLAEMLAAVEKQKQGRRWREGYVPNATTWLSQERWRDDVDDEPSAQGGPAYERFDDCVLCGGFHAVGKPCPIPAPPMPPIWEDK